jgi:DNA-binding PadR family transcriptional regulator
MRYPTLSWLEDMGYTSAEADQAGRKRYRITPEGQAFLTANRAAIGSLRDRC